MRVTAGLLLMPHGAQKLFGCFGGYGLTATGAFFNDTLGLQPGILFAVAVLLAVALSMHTANGFFWTAGGIEYPLMWLLLAVAICLRGGGDYSLGKRLGMPF